MDIIIEEKGMEVERTLNFQRIILEESQKAKSAPDHLYDLDARSET
jgi:hypothetical protein